ncbi:MAG: tetratricopeptide repeat protein [Dokdonella sp.]|uniref:serine/threonine-protein kinase n=1 Tax=Dokdonella sp. TaxID=2291710 RepID=UPI0032662C4F
MDLERKRHLFTLLRELMDAQTDARPGLIDLRCVDDPALAAQLRELLARENGDILDQSASDIAARIAGEDDAAEPLEGSIGPWRIVRLLGQGGMGSVWLAERDGDGYVQQGALKLIKRGMDSDAVLARFRRERQILSRLSHPNIASLLDGGVSEDGRPYLVMDYIVGVPLGEWASRTGADFKACVDLCLELTDALAHAHQRLIVHRDIKPGNVLVDADGHPHLLDFGIAKLLAETDADPTATAGRFLSRAYAAPEQLGGGNVTTATDVYMLGVMIFEFLTGNRFASNPSTGRVTLWASNARERAAQGSPPGVAPRALRGDTGIVLARATDADPARRYATVEAFADDLRNCRDGLPIRARADSAVYRLQRFAARHRIAAVSAVFAIVALVAGTGVALWQARVARDEARGATAAQAFLTSVFDASAPDTAAGARVTARELLDRGSERIRNELTDQPRLRAQMLVTLGTLYRQLGQFDQAAALLSDARQTLSNTDADLDLRARATIEAAVVERERGHLAESDALIAGAVALSPDGATGSRALVERAQLREKQGRFDEALVDARAAGTLDERRGTNGAGDRARDQQIEGLMLERLGRFDEAMGVFQQAIATAETVYGPDDTRSAQIHADFAVVLAGKGRAKEAEAEVRKALAVRRLRLGDDHPAVAESEQVLGAALRLQGRTDEALAAFEDALAIQRRTYGDRHALVANTLNSIGLLAIVRHDWKSAERTLREATTILRDLGQDRTTSAATMSNNLGSALMQLGRYDEAEPLMRGALALHLSVLGDSHPAVLSDSNGLALLALRRGHPAEAELQARRAARIADAVLGKGRDVASIHITLARALLTNSRAADALQQTEIAERLLNEADATGDVRHALALSTRADVLVALDRADEAQAIADAVLKEREARVPQDAADLAASHALLARIAKARGRQDERLHEREQAKALLATIPDPDPWLAKDIAAD